MGGRSGDKFGLGLREDLRVGWVLAGMVLTTTLTLAPLGPATPDQAAVARHFEWHRTSIRVAPDWPPLR